MKNLFGYYIYNIRKQQHKSLRECAKDCGISHTHIDSLEKGKDFRTGKKVSPTPETIEKIAKGLMIDETSLFNLSLEKVNIKFNEYLAHSEREDLKSNARVKIENNSSTEELSVQELIKLQEDIFIALFSRSLESVCFDYNHVDYPTYVAMLLKQQQFVDSIPQDVYNKLTEKYGIMDGINEGTTYYSPSSHNQFKLTSPDITNDYTTFPVIGEIAAGYDKIAIEDWTGEKVDIPNSYLKGHRTDEFFVLCVKGDSMYPTYQENDKVLILKQSSLDYSGQIGAIVYDDCATLKKIEYKEGEDWLRLIAINPSHPPKKIENEGLEQCTVLGVPKLLIRDIND